MPFPLPNRHRMMIFKRENIEEWINQQDKIDLTANSDELNE
jgi:hypothetical protein